jgi:5'-deoxynucleotidase YfbR-like HD superfamily hydrolase
MNYAHRSKARPANAEDDDWEIQLGGKLVDADLQPVNDLKQLYATGQLSLPTITEYCTAHESLTEADLADIEGLSTKSDLSARPRILSGAVVAGPFVAKSRAFIDLQIRNKAPDALAIDMESGPIADALRVLGDPAPRFVSIRAISDPGDSQKATFDRIGNGVFRRWAIANIAQVLVAAIRSLPFKHPPAPQSELDTATTSVFPDKLAQTYYVPHFIGQTFASYELTDVNAARFPNLRLLDQSGQPAVASTDDFVALLKRDARRTNVSLRSQSGSGKSALLYLAFRHLNAAEDQRVAFYIDIEQILKTAKPADLSQVAKSLSGDIAAYLSRHTHKTSVVLLFDGCVGDEREREIQSLIQTECSQSNLVSVYAEAASQIRNVGGEMHVGGESYLGSIDYDAEFELKAVSLRAESDAKALIAGFLASIPPGKAYISADELYGKLVALGFDYVTHYVISIFLENYTKPAYRRLETSAQFIETAMTSLIPMNQALGPRVSFDEVCFEALRAHSEELSFQRSDDDVRGVAQVYWAVFARQPRIVQTIMIARAVIRLFSSVASGDGVLHEQKIDRSTFLRIVFDNDVNSAIKHFMRDPVVEKKLLTSAKMLAEELDIDSLSFSLYLLGRISSARNKPTAHTVLQMVSGVFEQSAPTARGNVRNDDAEKRYELLAIRSLYISLANHGDQHAANRYIAKLIADPTEDELNRGFHLEYYGDRRSEDIGVDLQFSDDLKRWHRTSSYLLEHMREAAPKGSLSPINQIRLVTYLSFVRARHEAGCLAEVDRLATLELLDSIEECCAKLDGSAPSYVDMVRRNLQKPSFDTLDFVISLLALKGARRAGWASRGILVRDRYVETVAAHSFGCAMLAEILLDPADEHWRGINVAHVRTLTLLHDIGEFSIGDYLPSDKTAVNEAREIDYISTMGCYRKLRDLNYVRAAFNEYEAQASREAKLARDIDKMDALIQGYIYREDFPDAANYQRFMRDHFQQVHDTRLRELVERIVP